MDPIIHRIAAWDGLPLCIREWPVGDATSDRRHTSAELPIGEVDRNRPAGTRQANAFRPLLCLPGLVRTGGDFETVAAAIGAGRRVITIDYAGRGDSGRAKDIDRYAPEACIRDIMDACAALHIHDAIAIGTSFGGLLVMGLAAGRPGLIHAAVLNDIGPDIGADGADFVREFVGHDPALNSIEACVTFLRDKLPPLSLATDADWRRMAELTYQPGPDSRFHPVWDTRIARLLHRQPPDLWPLFGALGRIPVLLVRGEVSNILLRGTVSRMQAERPDMTVLEVPGIGHAPILTEPAAIAALEIFLAQVA